MDHVAFLIDKRDPLEDAWLAGWVRGLFSFFGALESEEGRGQGVREVGWV